MKSRRLGYKKEIEIKSSFAGDVGFRLPLRFSNNDIDYILALTNYKDSLSVDY